MLLTKRCNTFCDSLSLNVDKFAMLVHCLLFNYVVLAFERGGKVFGDICDQLLEPEDVAVGAVMG